MTGQPTCIITIRDTLVRLYAHPSVEHGRPWCALADVAGLAGYPPEMRPQTAAAIRDAYDLEAGRAYLGMTAGVPYAVWRDAAQRSALADTLLDPAGRVN